MSHFDESNSEKSAIEAKGADKRVSVSAKRLINCNQVDVNQLMPLKV